MCEIKYEAGGFMFVSDQFPDGYIFLSELVEFDRSYGWIPGCNVIGNKYANPELLAAV